MSSGPSPRAVSARRRGWNKARPLWPVTCLTAAVQRPQVPSSQGSGGNSSAAAAQRFGSFDDRRHRLFADLAPDLDIGHALDIAAHRKPQRLAGPRRQAVGDGGIGQLAQQPGVEMRKLGRIEARRAAAEAREIEFGGRAARLVWSSGAPAPTVAR